MYVLVMEGPKYYVGETDSFSKRVSQHRRNKERSGAYIMVAPIPGGKSDARTLETRMIRAMQSKGFELISAADGLRQL